ncbi:hypothetical protein B9Q02_00370 [Candidatus Marsarchaeota G1 archaeon BE_D]|jgi:methionine-gamma-lyase|uniref:Cystathionine beta-lyase n=2 Tax=Candidatus Marsarchaeota group 1 TaxID=2203770 RepID=A0A2R6AKK7_9ARCH|nr:MAG: hypothetical protein B9Q02_00370 [Candidatus Marsarchaeota G1 archaeon BE_D]PSN89555.1 MAG: hypothetical protein B9Q00_00770 [Candidatus Marsarchaeota G1 archaeon OSP_C]
MGSIMVYIIMRKNMKNQNKEWGISTKAVHSGQIVDIRYGSFLTPIFVQDAFINPNSNENVLRDPLSNEEYIYTRYGNPIITTVEQQIATLEGGEACLVFSSGMAAISTTLLAILAKGDHMISIKELYGQTYSLMKYELPKFGIETSFVSVSHIERIKDLIKKNTKILYLESITNPLLRVADLEKASKIAKEHEIMVVVDATFASPYNQNPLKFGADIVIHSATKYLNGHGDLIAGAVVSNIEIIRKIRQIRTKIGGNINPLDAYLLSRGLKTLAIRVERQNQNAMALARFLEKVNEVKRVYYPGLTSHPDYTVARRLLRGFGGVVSFEIAGGDEVARRFVEKLQICKKAPSLGSIHTLVTIPRDTSHHPRTGISEEELREMGINPGLIRISVGIEDIKDIISDLTGAFEKIDGLGGI